MRFFKINWGIVMRLFKFIGILIIAVSMLVSCKAYSEVLPPEVEQASKVKRDRANKLNELFGELKREPNFNKAKRLASRISLNWSSSGSATANALMVWAQQAMRDGRNLDAIDLLDQVVVLLPDYAEGWNRRATVYYVMKNYGKSMADIEQTLILEPRHFGALVGLAIILSTIGEDEKALAVYERVLSIYPSNRNAQISMMKIIKKLEQNEI